MASTWRFEDNEMAFITQAIKFFIETCDISEDNKNIDCYGEEISAKDVLAFFDRLELATLRMEHLKKSK
jgi:hypothetical protein